MRAPTPTTDVLVAGAGIVGVASALWAQRRGGSVILADANPPGSGASFGNAGTIATYGCVPVNSPSILRDLPRLLASKSGPLRIDWLFALRNMPWMLAFLRNCTPTRVRHISDALGDLLSRTDAGLVPLVAEAGADDLFVENDFLYAWSTQKAHQQAGESIESRRRNGVAMDFLSGAEIADLEPGISIPFHAGIRFKGGRHVRDPQALVTRLFDSFITAGGQFIAANVTATTPHDAGVAVHLANGETIEASNVVIAAGAHARAIEGSGAEDLPLGTERGYHVMYAGQAGRVNRPVLWGEAAFYATPMDAGLRFAGTVEIASLDAPPTQARIDAITERANIMFDGLGAPTSSWLGFRPTMPDSLPVIGTSHRSSRIHFAFGHQHLGLTLGGITGRAIADLIDGRQPNFDLSPYDPARFNPR